MTELKTLKDIVRVYKRERIVDEYALKALAIKWVKACPMCVRIKCDACIRMMEFHNITEEDLEEKKE